MRRAPASLPMRLLLPVACLALAATARAQAPERHALVLARGADTITLERVTTTPARVTGEMLDRTGRMRFTWSLDRVAGRATRFLLLARGANDAPNLAPRQRLEITFGADSVTGTMTVGSDAPVTRRMVAPPPGALPYINPSMGLVEQLARALVADGSPGGTGTFFLPNGMLMSPKVARVGADSLRISLGGVEVHVATDRDGRLNGGTIPSQGITLTRLPWLDDAAMAVPKPDYSAPPGAPYVAEEVRVPTGRGYELVGTFTRPVAATGKVPVAVTITGSGPQDRDEGTPALGDYKLFRAVADTLGRRGIGVLRLDDRGVGASGGTFATSTSADFADDVRSALAWLRARADVDAKRLFLVGHSEGGMVAPMVAATDQALAGIVLMAGPALDGRTILDFQLRNLVRGDSTRSAAARDSALARVPAQLDSIATSGPWMRFFMAHDPIKTARQVKVPVLILQGGTDQQVTPEQAVALERAFRATGNRDVTQRTFAATNHLFVADANGYPGGYGKLPSLAVRPEVLGALADWIAAHVAGARP